MFKNEIHLNKFVDLIGFIRQFMNTIQSCPRWKVSIGGRMGQECCEQEKRKDGSRQSHLPLGGRAMGLVK